MNFLPLKVPLSKAQNLAVQVSQISFCQIDQLSQSVNKEPSNIALHKKGPTFNECLLYGLFLNKTARLISFILYEFLNFSVIGTSESSY